MGSDCDKLVTTVCVLCILCASHSHCSLHGPQLPRASFHHHGQSKMGRPPDATINGNTLSSIAKSSANVSPSNHNEQWKWGGSTLTKKDLVTNMFLGAKLFPLSRHFLVSEDVVSKVQEQPTGRQWRPSTRRHTLGRSRRSAGNIVSPAESPSNELSPFVDEIFREYGDGKVIGIDGFKKMLGVLRWRGLGGDGVGSADRRRVGGDHHQDEVPSERPPLPARPLPCSHSELRDGKVPFRLPTNASDPSASSNTSSSQWHCLTGSEILSIAEVNSLEGKMKVNHSEFMHRLCPAMLYGALGVAESMVQVADVLPSSTHHKDHPHDNEDHDMEPFNSLPSGDPKVWLYASLSVIGISLCGLLGVAVIPVMQKVFYHQLLQFLVALAVGTLCGDALIHLLPHAMSPPGHHDHDDLHASHDLSHEDHHETNMWKGLGTLIGLVFFFTTEKCLTLVGDWRKRRQKRNKPVPSRVRVMREAGPAMESTGQGHNSVLGTDVLLGPSGSNSPRLGVAVSSNSVGEKLCKHKYSSYPYCYGEITTGEIIHETASAPVTVEERCVVEEKKSKQRRQHNGCSESAGSELGDEKLEKLMVHDGSEGFVKSPIEGIGRGYPESSGAGGALVGDDGKEEEEEVRNSLMVILREHERPHHGHSHTHGHVHSAPESISSVAWMVIMGDGLHNLTDGMAIGAAFAAGIAGGFSTAVAVFCHELPHELGDFAVLLKAGMTAKQAVFYNLLSSLLCFFGMMLGIFLGDTESASQWIFAAAAGMFLYIALVDMIPELTTSHSREGGSLFQSVLQLLGVISGVGIMLLIALYEHDLKDIFGGN